MKLFANKFLIIGILTLLLISIPLTLFLIKRQQEVKTQAAPSSNLSFSPAATTTSTQCSAFTTDVMIDPGTNVVSIVNLYMRYDPTLLDITSITPSADFPHVKTGTPVINAGQANISVDVGGGVAGGDLTKTVQTPTKVVTIMFRPKAAGSAQIQFLTEDNQTAIYSLGPSDQPYENVLSTATPGNITITSGVCPTGSAVPTATPSASLTPTATVAPAASPSPTPTVAANQSPVCSSLAAVPGSTTSSILFTAKGNDPDASGLITKASFNFGDGQVQDVTEGMNLQNVTVQTSHTYQNSGTFAATVAFTDNSGTVSNSCSQTFAVAGTPSATVAPTATTAPAPPTAEPTIPPTGSTARTFGAIAAVIITIIGGFILLAL